MSDAQIQLGGVMGAPRGAKRIVQTIEERGHTLGGWFLDGVDRWVSSCTDCRGEVTVAAGVEELGAKLRKSCSS